MVKIFGFVLAAGVVGTSLAMWVMGERWQRIERSAYGGERRPWWFYVGSVLLIAFYGVALAAFLGSPDKTWAGWVLMLVIPLGWVIKGGLLVFSEKGRKKITAIAGDEGWRKVALARLPVALILVILAALA
ncbi:MAG: hypothetical protein Q8N93_09510 [Bacillota bacterium]|nr:hypothetical protein [Bacillota bacterium]MDP3051361.1 hypothetical protein [Eubacteriales bacterium]